MSASALLIGATSAWLFLPPTLQAQVVTFDFSAPMYAATPLDQTVSGLTAHFTSSPLALGYSIQDPTSLAGFVPAGFAGNCLAPNGVFASDLLIAFDKPLQDISILYAPDELATDSSCTVRITAYAGLNPVGTSTTTINPPGTWPTGTLSLGPLSAFDNVVIHYDSPPPTGGDYNEVFMVDNLVVTVAAVVPEPVSASLFGVGILGAALWLGRHRRSRQVQ